MIESLWPWVEQQVLHNEIFAGLVGGSIVATLLFALRSLPGRLWQLFLLRQTTELTVFNDDEAFDWLNEWLAKHPYAARTRRLKLSTFGRRQYDAAPIGYDEKGSWTLSPGLGSHLFFHQQRLVWLKRERGEPGTGTAKRKPHESFNIRIFSRSTKRMRDLIAEAEQLREGETRTDIYIYDDYWQRVARRLNRPIESVVLPQEQLNRIISDAEWFASAAPWYSERGVPYRRGYLLSGPPGCGKTSLTLALAAHLARPVYSLNLGSVANDDQLFTALGGVPEQAVLLIEDIDVAMAAQSRDEKPDKPEKGMTLSGLLNAIDGVASTDGRILIMTSNRPENLDDALVRPGRIDMREHIGPAGPDEAARLFKRFFPDYHQTEVVSVLTASQIELPGAVLQAILLDNNKDPDAALAEMTKKETK